HDLGLVLRVLGFLVLDQIGVGHGLVVQGDFLDLLGLFFFLFGLGGALGLFRFLDLFPRLLGLNDAGIGFARRGRTRARTPHADDRLGRERERALRTDDRPLAQIVELCRATRTNALGT